MSIHYEHMYGHINKCSSILICIVKKDEVSILLSVIYLTKLRKRYCLDTYNTLCQCYSASEERVINVVDDLC